MKRGNTRLPLPHFHSPHSLPSAPQTETVSEVNGLLIFYLMFHHHSIWVTGPPFATCLTAFDCFTAPQIPLGLLRKCHWIVLFSDSIWLLATDTLIY